jgi:hypothetical protein
MLFGNGTDGFLAAYDVADGSFAWARHFGGWDAEEILVDVTATRRGVFAVGRFGSVPRATGAVPSMEGTVVGVLLEQ